MTTKLDLSSPRKRTTPPPPPPTAKATPQPPTLADELKASAGRAGKLTGTFGSVVHQFAGVGMHAREGTPAIGCTLVLSVSGRQLVAEVSRPARPRSHDLRKHDVPWGQAADLSAAVDWIDRELGALRETSDTRYGPLLLLICPELSGDVDWPRLKKLAADHSATVAVVQESDGPPAWEQV